MGGQLLQQISATVVVLFGVHRWMQHRKRESSKQILQTLHRAKVRAQGDLGIFSQGLLGIFVAGDPLRNLGRHGCKASRRYPN
jgi:hypothetical protein